MCTTTSHVITLASRVTVLALVSLPKTSVRSSASVAQNVSIHTLGMLQLVSANNHILSLNWSSLCLADIINRSQFDDLKHTMTSNFSAAVTCHVLKRYHVEEH